MSGEKNKKGFYFIALLPPSEIMQQVKKFKLKIKDLSGAERALRLPAHITLQIPFKILEKEERKLKELLSDFAEKQSPFNLKLCGFEKFGHKVIYIKPEESEELNNLQKNLSLLLQENFSLKDHEKSQKFHPHITLATKDLNRKKFPEIWNIFREREYNRSFSANSLILFKHNGSTWDLDSTFPLNQSDNIRS